MDVSAPLPEMVALDGMWDFAYVPGCEDPACPALPEAEQFAAQLQVPGCTYMTPVYPIPGTGTLKIAQLAGDQKAQHCSTGGKKMLIKGSQFTAKFEVQSPAQQPTPGGPVPDATPQYSGQGMFVPSNVMKTAT